MELNLRGRVVLVAGSSSGIGKAIARAFLAEGCRTVITGRDEEKLSTTSAEFAGTFGAENVLSRAGDLRQPADIRSCLEMVLARWDALHCVVANIGSGRGKTGWALSAGDWKDMFETNLFGSAALAQECIPQMQEGGCIVFIASIAGREALAAPLPYSAAKGALINYVNNLARILGEKKIRVNAIAPGNILFPGGSWEKRLRDRPEETTEYVRREVPLRRFGQPEEVADMAVFLCSERAAFITGSCCVVDGGQARSI